MFGKMLLRRLNVFIARSVQFRSINLSTRVRRMQEGFVEVNSVPTHIFTWGQWIQDRFDPRTKDIVLVVSGNPGLAGFYTKFCSTLFDELDKEVPVWVIGHAGHDRPKKLLNMVTPPLKGNEELYNLQGQLNHKIEFIHRYVPKGVNVYLIGHSVGAHICLNLLKMPSSFSEQVKQAYLMFPTIERMSESQKGREVPSFNRFFFLLRIFYYMFHWIPTNWKRAVVRWHSRRNGMPEDFLDSCVEYTNPPVIDCIWFMALDEMEKIREIDEEVVRSNMHRLKLYYGTIDGWVPTEYYYELIEKFEGIDAELCKQKYEHAFVLKTGPEVGKMVSEWINQKRKVDQTKL